MSIRYENNKTFTIDTENSTYQMMVDSYGYLLHLYYGRKTQGDMEYLLTYADRGFSGNPYDAGIDRLYSLDVLPQEFPQKGTGDFRSTACVIEYENGSTSSDLKYDHHKISKGKYSIPGLPAFYADQEGETLEIVLKDKWTGLEISLLYGVIPSYDVITRSVKVHNTTDNNVIIRKLSSACLDFVYGEFDLLTFYGRHCMERQLQRKSVAHGNFSFGSVRGCSGHQYNPMMILAGTDANEDYGDCYGVNFVYSGSFQGEVEKDQFNQTRVLMGLQEMGLAYPVEPDQVFYAPEAVLTFSSQGFSKLSHNLHRCIRKHLTRGIYKEAVRPVLVNSWEAAYFDFTGETIYRLAVKAKQLGIDMVVMDDGWFGKRDNDFSSLGDWVVNEKKLGESLGHLIERVNDLGVKFGIWIEPECISEDSKLFKEHPDWAFRVPGKDPVRARYQLVLDFSRKEVVDAIFDMICKVLDQGNVEYVKWDMNRHLEDVYSQTAQSQGRVLYDYVLGLYNFQERLITRYPNILLEGCCGGGGRFDLGMLYYSPQIWCSDNTDAMDRLKIQYGTSFGYPVSAMGSHVSDVPNHQTGRYTPFNLRGTVAMSGTFGYELDLRQLTGKEQDAVKEQIAHFRQYAPLIQDGLYYRLTNPMEDEAAAWMFVSEDGREALLNVVLQAMHGNMTNNYVRLKGLLPGRFYREEESGKIYPSDALMQMGLPMPVEFGNYKAYQMHFELV
ncbi:MAG: alpha-galactosidase [Lachnospiraceae bacterium]|nr:alpha-galactosidase [Candidatus Equihabitans merdae]